LLLKLHVDITNLGSIFTTAVGVCRNITSYLHC